jgi:hypothetical protein
MQRLVAGHRRGVEDAVVDHFLGVPRPQEVAHVVHVVVVAVDVHLGAQPVLDRAPKCCPFLCPVVPARTRPFPPVRVRGEAIFVTLVGGHQEIRRSKEFGGGDGCHQHGGAVQSSAVDAERRL